MDNHNILRTGNQFQFKPLRVFREYLMRILIRKLYTNAASGEGFGGCSLRMHTDATHLQTDIKTVWTNLETNVAKAQVDF